MKFSLEMASEWPGVGASLGWGVQCWRRAAIGAALALYLTMLSPPRAAGQGMWDLDLPTFRYVLPGIGVGVPGNNVRLLPDQNISTADTVSWNNAVLDASIVAHFEATCDRLRLDQRYHSGVTVQGGQILWQSRVVGTVSDQGGQTLHAEFNSTADKIAVGAVLDTLSYSNACPNGALYANNLPRTVRITLSDGAGHTQTGDAFVEFLYFTNILFSPNPLYVAPNGYVAVLMTGVLNGGFETDFNYPVGTLDLFCGTLSSAYPEVVVHAVKEPPAGERNTECVMGIYAQASGALSGPKGTLRLNIIGDPCVVDFLEFVSFLRPAGGFAPGEGLFSPASPAPPAVSVPNFRALESLMNQTAEGQRLAGLYREHTAEIVRLMLYNSYLRAEALQLVQDFQPGVAALLAGNGSGSQITQGMVDCVNRVMGDFAFFGSTNLRTAIQTETNRLNGLQDFVNKDFNQWAGMLQVSVPTNAWIQITRPQLDNGQFSVQANGVEGLDYSLTRAPAVTSVVWEPVTNTIVTLNGFTVSLTDPTPDPSRPFYRARAQRSAAP